MDLKIRIPDSLLDKYTAKYGTPRHYVAMIKALEAFADLDDGDRFLFINGDTRRAIEAVFQTTMDTPEMLLKNIQKLNRVRIGGIDMEFTPEDLQRLDTQASFHGRTRQQFIKEQIDEIFSRMMERV